MKRIVQSVTWLSIVAVWAAIAANVSAQCRTVYSSTYSNYTPSYSAYVAPQLVVPVAQYINIPLYTAVFIPSAVTPVVPVAPAAPAMPATDNSSKVMLELLSEMKAMRQDQKDFFGRLQSPNPPPATPKQPQASNDNTTADAAVAVLKKPLGMSNVSCLTCHSQGVPEEKSGGFHLFDNSGKFLGVSEDLAKSMARKISKERVCPGAPAALKGQDKEIALAALPKQ